MKILHTSLTDFDERVGVHWVRRCSRNSCLPLVLLEGSMDVGQFFNQLSINATLLKVHDGLIKACNKFVEIRWMGIDCYARVWLLQLSSAGMETPLLKLRRLSIFEQRVKILCRGYQRAHPLFHGCNQVIDVLQLSESQS